MFNNKIKVRVDKSHLFTLGEKMYKESIEFIRELVNNAYDADAVNARILISDEKIQVQDDGAGMNEKGLEQFFTIGSEEKKIHGVSPRFGRKRVGQFGIGKFSALALANQFIVETVKKIINIPLSLIVIHGKAMKIGICRLKKKKQQLLIAMEQK